MEDSDQTNRLVNTSQKLPNGLYTGELLNNLPNGYGKLIYNDGRVYLGNWVNGLKEGSGEMTFIDGVVYVGQWKNNLRHGYGKQSYPNLCVCEGEWVSDKKNGLFKITYQNNSVVNCYYVKNNMCDFKQTCANGDIIESQFIDHKVQGNVKYTTRGKTYVGVWIYHDGKTSGILESTDKNYDIAFVERNSKINTSV